MIELTCDQCINPAVQWIINCDTQCIVHHRCDGSHVNVTEFTSRKKAELHLLELSL